MKKTVYDFCMRVTALCALAVLINCTNAEVGDLPRTVNIPLKQIPSGISVAPVLYVDVAAEGADTLLAAKNYVLSSDGSPFFDYVIVGPAVITRAAGGRIELDISALNTVFDNRSTYIKPLRDKGIKVVLGIQGNPGNSFGFGKFNQKEAQDFAAEVDRWVSFYRLNGVDFYDTGAPAGAYPPSSEFKALFAEKIAAWREVNAGITDAEIETKLWKEGASNFMLLIMAMQSKNAVYSEDTTTDTLNSRRVMFVHNKNFGANLFESVRDAYMPDAYTGHGSGAEDFLTYLLQEYDTAGNYWVQPEYGIDKLKPMQIWARGENTKNDFTAMKSAPLAIDLSAAGLTPSTVDRPSKCFAFFNPDDPGSFTAATAAAKHKWNKYGAIYYTNLPSADVSAVLSATSQVLLGSAVTRE
jgi:hypothetical protein